MNHEVFMQRCFDLAELGSGFVSPNPKVGAVLVHDGRIIGEGWHRRFGQAHAEVNAVGDVKAEDRHLIPKSALYVSLEPCCFYGNTPACTDLILSSRIPRVVISCLDKTPGVNGRGIEILAANGVEVITGVLAEKGEEISRFRNTFVTQKRPYVTLKFAISQDGFLGRVGESVWLSNDYSKRYVHKLRAEYDAILVGTNTAQSDNPVLTNRLWFGRSPLRILIDRNLKIQDNYNLYSGSSETIVLNELKDDVVNNSIRLVRMGFGDNLVVHMLDWLYEQRITSLIVEGGAFTLQKFMASGMWDEAHIIYTPIKLVNGIEAPVIKGILMNELKIGTNTLTIHRNEVKLPLK